MELSARNQLRGTLTSVERGAVEAEVSIDIGNGQTVVSTISLASADRLGLKEGDRVTAIVKATDVIIGK